MKRTILTLCCYLFAVTIVFGQTVNGVSIKDIDAEYIQIVGQAASLLSSKQAISIDFGQATHSLGSKKHFVIKDVDGKPMTFNTMIDALNFMSKNGYQFVQAYVLPSGDSGNCYYLMKKKDHGKKADMESLRGVQEDKG